jgi:hypothetical protein
VVKIDCVRCGSIVSTLSRLLVLGIDFLRPVKISIIRDWNDCIMLWPERPTVSTLD